jgi:acylphosphatase
MTVRYLVSGLVQGVGFRWFALRRAQSLGITGFVRNLADGTVEIVGQGEASDLNRLEELLSQGPRSAKVTRVDKAEILDEVTEYNTFDVK